MIYILLKIWNMLKKEYHYLIHCRVSYQRKMHQSKSIQFIQHRLKRFDHIQICPLKKNWKVNHYQKLTVTL